MSERRWIELRVNGADLSGEVEPRVHLADFLREELNLRGTHLGCEQGVCGACTVLVDGEPMRACLILAVQAEGREVTTVEGLADGDDLHPLQESFREHHGLQCGFCTPGFLMTTLYLLEQGVDLTDEATAREALSGNICRCTGYQNIIDAIRHASSVHQRDAA